MVKLQSVFSILNYSSFIIHYSSFILVLPVHLWSDAFKLFENADIITGVRIAELRSYLRNSFVAVSEQLLGLINLISIYITHKIFAYIAGKGTGKVAFAYAA